MYQQKNEALHTQECTHMNNNAFFLLRPDLHKKKRSQYQPFQFSSQKGKQTFYFFRPYVITYLCSLFLLNNFLLLQQQELMGSKLFTQAQQYLQGNNFEQCLLVLQQCLEIRTKVLYRYHKDIAETQDCIARCYASVGKAKLK